MIKHHFKYLYTINYPPYEEDLCRLEIKTLFGIELNSKYILTDTFVEPSRSPYLKELVRVRFANENLDELLTEMGQARVSYEDFKIVYIKMKNDGLEYQERLNIMYRIGDYIEGDPDIHDPKLLLCIVRVEGIWMFGEYEKNDFKWHDHISKPVSYSISLSVRTARAIVNIAVGNDFDLRLIDPCCGVGTVLVEALSMGIDIEGSDLSSLVVQNAQENLAFFGYDENLVTNRDINHIDTHYDVAIIDMPYGLFSHISEEQKENIIKSARRIASKLILLSLEDLEEVVTRHGFKIEDSCVVNKGKFVRRLLVCK